MARTINRTPYTVSEPDIRYKFFNHNNWKGVCDDKNFLGVDQESFADAKNVYIDSEGVLKTRPSVVEKSLTNLTNCTVYDAQTYENTLVLKVYNNSDSKWYYKFYVDNAYITQGETTEKSKILLFDNKLIIFNGENDSINPYTYYDLIKKTFNADASPLIYIPILNVYASETATIEQESKNILTNSYKDVFVYTVSGMPIQAIGKDLYYYLNDVKVHLYSYTEKLQKYIMSTKYSLKNTSNDTMNRTAIAYLNTDSRGACLYQFIPKVPVSCVGNSTLKCIGSNVLLNTAGFSQTSSYQYVTTSLSYSFDGNTFLSVKAFPNNYVAKHGLPVLSKDGSTIYAVLSSSSASLSSPAYLYAITPSNTSLSPQYSDWTLIYTFPENVIYAEIFAIDNNNFSINWANASGAGFCVRSKNGTITNMSSPGALGYSRTYYIDDTKIETYYNDYENALKVLITQNSVDKLFALNVAMKSGLYVTSLDTMSVNITKDASKSKYTFSFCYIDKQDTFGHFVTIDIPFSMTANNVVITDVETGPGVDVNGMYCIAYIDGVAYVTTYEKLSTTSIVTNVHSSDEEDIVNYFTMLLPTTEYLGVLWTGSEGYVVTNKLTDEKINLYADYNNSLNAIFPDFISTLNQNVIAISNKTYIDANRESDDLSKKLLYFPEALLKRYDYDVNALHPISTSQMGVFFDDSVWIIQRSENKLTDTIYPDYLYTKSQVHVGLTKGSDVVTSYDGKNVIFATQRGLVAMSYQDFIASTDQSLSYLSDSILVPFVNYCKDSAIKMFLFRYWLIVYKQNAAKMYVIDLRNGSWWPMEYKQGLVSACVNDGVPLLVSDGSLFAFNTDDKSCKDWDNTLIVWKLLSQKLHFNAPNYYKHLYSLTINAVNNSQKPIAYLLGTTNYRNIANVNSDEVMNYQVDIIRSYVKRMNYSKVNEFQYELRNSKSTPSRLSISNITLKYTITSLVR